MSVGQASSSSIVSSRCPRCHVGLRPGAKRCQACGEMLRGGRRPSFYLSILGVILILLVVAAGLLIEPGSVDKDGNDADAPQDQTATPAPPPKEPPLNR
jgi:hypothetical protein